MIRFILAIAILTLVSAGVSELSAQSTCRRCDDCAGDYHKNVDSAYSLKGNIDAKHDCNLLSCEAMFYNGIHQPVYDCQGGMAYSEAANGEMSGAKAIELLSSYPNHVRADGDLLVILDCAGDHILAAFEIGHFELPAQSNTPFKGEKPVYSGPGQGIFNLR